MVSKNEMMHFLRRSRDNRGVMASLRCLLKASQRFRGWQSIAHLDGIGCVQAEAVAGLYALHPKEREDKNYNFGDACRALAAARRTDKESAESPFDKRFRRLLSCSSKQELCIHLTDVVRGLKTADVPVNYEGLFDDITKWGDLVRERWAIHYWSHREEEGDVSD